IPARCSSPCSADGAHEAGTIPSRLADVSDMVCVPIMCVSPCQVVLVPAPWPAMSGRHRHRDTLHILRCSTGVDAPALDPHVDARQGLRRWAGQDTAIRAEVGPMAEAAQGLTARLWLAP